ncbi:MAG: hypothetical protein ACREPL_14590 [Rhodanobacteraceae bacterium]
MRDIETIAGHAAVADDLARGTFPVAGIALAASVDTPGHFGFLSNPFVLSKIQSSRRSAMTIVCINR